MLGLIGRPTLLGESIADWSYSGGSEGILVTFFSRTYLGTLVDRATRSLRQLIIAPVSNVTCNQSFVSHANIYELAIDVKCIYQNEHWTFFEKQNRKRKNNWQFVWKSGFVLILNLPVNRRLCTRGRRPSKRTPPNNRVYTIL